MKRLFDVLFSSFLILLFFPLLFVIILCSLFFQGYPCFFSQVRVGLNGRDFKIYKFRTMTVNDEAINGSFDVGSCARVTKWGSLLRKSKLDELPQLFNVFKGDMSFIGPRPEVRRWVDVYPERWSKIHQVRPGISDPASIIYRNEEDILAQSDNPQRCYREEVLPAKLDLYEKYVDNQSLLNDLLLIFKTILVVIKG